MEYETQFFIPVYNTNLCVISLLNNNSNKSVAFCTLFEDKELHSNNIITSPHYKEKHLMINGTKFTIVHQVSHLAPEIAYIPIEAFISNQLTTNSIHFVLSDIPTKNDYIDIENEINAHFQECTISFPPR